ncbi:WecB/TagA/CpsF family glycosyltransferase [Winogradskyella sp. PE311]|uniref:WecB/TagA/CpsF family glycosyltransferase n=1 Tax=Winogradskyella sp. PE311 TaxID=3366943 RepID=UPI00397F052D
MLQDIDLDSVRVINTLNPHSYCISKKDKDFENALKASDILLPDGVGIVWAEKLLNRSRIHKIAGFDLFKYLMNHLNVSNGSCFFLGASEATLKLIKENAIKDYPNVKVYSYSPPYKSVFSKTDSKLMFTKVNTVKPDVLFVGMTAPKQEKWVHDYNNNLNAKIICSIGAVFDFYAGTVKRPSQFWIKLGLEWLPRLLKEPKRLAKRNFISTPKFILEVIYFKIFKKGFL